jgi:hypothetical protein
LMDAKTGIEVSTDCPKDGMHDDCYKKTCPGAGGKGPVRVPNELFEPHRRLHSCRRLPLPAKNSIANASRPPPYPPCQHRRAANNSYGRCPAAAMEPTPNVSISSLHPATVSSRVACGMGRAIKRCGPSKISQRPLKSKRTRQLCPPPQPSNLHLPGSALQFHHFH